MHDLMSTALVMAGIFVVCYPVAMYLINRIMTKMESENRVTSIIN
jgi:hypothetical protein